MSKYVCAHTFHTRAFVWAISMRARGWSKGILLPGTKENLITQTVMVIGWQRKEWNEDIERVPGPKSSLVSLEQLS